ncbi:MAG: carbohydrate-binding family 9-like protein [Myxococcota bacterium]
MNLSCFYRGAVGLLLLAFSIALAGCVEQTTELTAAQREQVREFVGTSATSPENELSIAFEDKVEFIGYDVSGEVKPGSEFTVTWHWKVKEALDEGWRLFTHIADATGNDRMNGDGFGVVRELYQPGRWKAGEYVRDAQPVTLPDDWNSGKVNFFIGLWNGPARLRITDGPNDGDNRARIPSLDVGGGTTAEAPEQPARPDVPTLRASLTSAVFDIDGKLDEEAWATAPTTGRFVNTMNGAAAEPESTVKVLWNNTHLYLGFQVADDFLKATRDERDAHLWEGDDLVEIMIDPGADQRNYFEIQVSPTGNVFDTRYNTRRNPGPIGDNAWNVDMEVGVSREGEVNDEDADEGYVVELAIKWSSFAAGQPPATTPAANDTWAFNFYVMDQQQQGNRAAAWSPPREGDFHALNRFGQIMFQGIPDPSRLRVPPEILENIRNQNQPIDTSMSVDQPRPGEEIPTPENPNPSMGMGMQ